MKNFSIFCIDRHITCLEALKKLTQENSNQTLFVLDENNRLMGTVTDGDIRRGLIRGLGLESEIEKFCFTNYSYINNKIDVANINRLKKEGIKVLPKLNENGQIEKVYDLSRLNSILPTHALIMAGGRGERLRPLTDSIPKPLLKLGDKPILEHNIDRLISFGLESFTISVRYLHDQIINYFGDGSSKGVNINYIIENEPLGTIGCAAQLGNFDHESLLVLNSDIFTNIDFENFYLDFEKTNADMAVATIPYSVDIPYAIMELENNNVRSFKEKPKNTYYANAGIYLVKKKNIAIIPKNTFYNATDLMEYIIANKMKLIHSPITGFWIDIGKHDDYNKANEMIRHI